MGQRPTSTSKSRHSTSRCSRCPTRRAFAASSGGSGEHSCSALLLKLYLGGTCLPTSGNPGGSAVRWVVSSAYGRTIAHGVHARALNRALTVQAQLYSTQAAAHDTGSTRWDAPAATRTPVRSQRQPTSRRRFGGTSARNAPHSLTEARRRRVAWHVLCRRRPPARPHATLRAAPVAAAPC
jgi:hypothetical protein